jgi:carbon starvation protein
VWRKGHIKEATIIGVTLMFLGVIYGGTFAESSWGHYLVLTPHQITAALAVYGFAAATMPVWMLLTPRAYLSTYMKIGTILFLALGVIIVNPELKAPAL